MFKCPKSALQESVSWTQYHEYLCSHTSEEGFKQAITSPFQCLQSRDFGNARTNTSSRCLPVSACGLCTHARTSRCYPPGQKVVVCGVDQFGRSRTAPPGQSSSTHKHVSTRTRGCVFFSVFIVFIVFLSFVRLRHVPCRAARPELCVPRMVMCHAACPLRRRRRTCDLASALATIKGRVPQLPDLVCWCPPEPGWESGAHAFHASAVWPTIRKSDPFTDLEEPLDNAARGSQS